MTGFVDTTPEIISLEEMDWDIACDCRWHGSRVGGDSPAEWYIKFNWSCDCPKREFYCSPCRDAIHSFTGAVACADCDIRAGRPADFIVREERLR